VTLRRGAATRLTVYLHADAHWHHHSVSDEIIHRAHNAGLAGASRFHGFLGYGRLGILHSDIDPDISGDLPCAVEIVDPSEERLRAFLAQIEEVLDHGLVILEPTEIVAVFSESASESAAEGMRA
jgi:PII-like signaling protein